MVHSTVHSIARCNAQLSGHLADGAAACRADEPQHGAPDHLELHNRRQVVEAGQHLQRTQCSTAHTVLHGSHSAAGLQMAPSVQGSRGRQVCKAHEGGQATYLLKESVPGWAATHAPSQLQVACDRPPSSAGSGRTVRSLR